MPTKSAKKVARKTKKRSSASKRVARPKVRIVKPRLVKAASPQPTPRARFSLSRRTIGLISITIGFNLILFSGLYLLYRQTILSFKASPQFIVQADLRTAEPSIIEIEDLGLKQLVTPANIANGIWETSDTNATHLSSSARPGENGNIVVYGHNRETIFRKLHSAKNGQIVRIKTSNGLQYEYEITSIQRIKPDQIEVVLPTEYEILTIYTCIGFLDSERLVIQAKPVTQIKL